ncbi:beta strand repeat-containing protein, partial [Fodinibius salsisoli]
MSNKALLFTLVVALFTLMMSCNDNGPGKINLEITAVSPDSGSVGTEVTISGSGFVPKASDNIVRFNDTEAQVLSVTSEKIVTKVPVGATSGPIVVEVGGKEVTGPSFVITDGNGGGDALSITTLDPMEGPIGTEVTITGTGFSPQASENVVTFDGTLTEVKSVNAPSDAKANPAITDSSSAKDVSPKGTLDAETTNPSHNKSFTDTSNTVQATDELVITVPSGVDIGLATVELTVDGETVNGPDFNVTEGDNGGDAPSIDSIDPTEGPTGTEVTITGSNFGATADENTVKFGDTEATINSASATEVVAVVPDGLSPGAVDVTLTTNGQTATAPDQFTVTDDGGGDNNPSIGNIDPTEGPTGTEVTITGSNFGPNPEDNTVTFNGAEATVSSASDTELVVIVPEDATTGPVEVTVDGNTATGPDFTVTDDGGGDNNPSIDGINPTEGPTGTEVTINGSNFGPNPEDNIVTFNGAEATVSSASDTELVVIVPEDATTGPVEVTVDGNTATGPDFTVTDDGGGDNNPSIDGINPTEGPTGTAVTITGSNFSATADNNTVQFGDATAEITAASETELTAVVPDELSPGDVVPVSVTVNSQSATGPDFTVTEGDNNNPPSIDGITPTEGPIGTEVTITGSNFSPTASENTVTFDGTEATVNSASETELVAVVPDGATTGPVAVTVDGQTATGPDFTVTDGGGGGEAPAIDAIDPTEGPTGTAVTITGTNFSATAGDNTVEFGSATATVTSASTTELVAEVPSELSA